jgi:hypothetical protein
MNELIARQIHHSPALEDAAVAVTLATNGCGCAVRLCDPLNPRSVESALREVTGWFADPSFFIDCKDDTSRKPGNSRLAAATNLALLATLYLEHVKAGNVE